MQIICSLGGIVSYEYPRQGLSDIASGGLDGILLDIGGIVGYHAHRIVKWRKKRDDKSYRHWIMDHPTEIQDIVAPFVDVIRSHKLATPIARANFLPPILRQEEDNDDLFSSICRVARGCVEAAGKAGCRYIILRPMAVGIGERNVMAANVEYYRSLADTAKRYGLEILLESQYRIHNGSFIRGLCSDAHEAAALIDRLNDETRSGIFGSHMDTGICSLLCQNMHDIAAILGQRIKAVTIRDCDGMSDTAYLPFTSVFGGSSRTDWLNIIRGLREIRFDGLLIMDLSGTASAMSPLLKPSLIRFSKEVAEHIAWQIGMEDILQRYGQRVLFGAGNMCRAYMKCYGEKYPPLFTCDNDKDKWGTKFCGLDVRSPDALRDLPEGCAILICNIYYREIERQLKDIGIEAPVGYFNDEYMPSFHFERLEDIEEENDAAAWGTDAERR